MPKPKKKPAAKKMKKILHPPPKSGTKPFGQRLKAWRKAQTPPLSQSGAAELFKIQVQTLQTWEQGIREPSFSYSEAIFTRLIQDGF